MLKKGVLICLLSVMIFVSCSSRSTNEPYDTNTRVAKGEPAFTPLGRHWTIDNTNVLDKKTITEADEICQRLQNDGIAEMIVLLQNGVKNPEDYATKYGRWLKLGKRGLATEGGQNGFVWLIRPDADKKMTCSIGRGLPRFTSVDSLAIIEKAKDYINFNNFDAGVLLLVKETDKKLREVYYKPKEEKHE